MEVLPYSVVQRIAHLQRFNKAKRHIAIVFNKSGSIIACAISREEYHAETNVLKKTNKQNGLSMLVLRYSYSGIIGMSKPCYHCSIALAKFGIKYVYYSDDKDNLVFERVVDLKGLLSNRWRNKIKK